MSFDQTNAGERAESGGRRELRGLWFDRRPLGVAKTSGAFVWLAFILFPAVNAVAKHGTTLDRTLTIAAAVAFSATYIALILAWRSRYADRILPALFVILIALATALTLSDGSSWGFLFTYCAACAGLISPRFGFAGVIGCAVLAGVTAGGGLGGEHTGHRLPPARDAGSSESQRRAGPGAGRACANGRRRGARALRP
jgi:hypothetical protein